MKNHRLWVGFSAFGLFLLVGPGARGESEAAAPPAPPAEGASPGGGETVPPAGPAAPEPAAPPATDPAAGDAPAPLPPEHPRGEPGDPENPEPVSKPVEVKLTREPADPLTEEQIKEIEARLEEALLRLQIPEKYEEGLRQMIELRPWLDPDFLKKLCQKFLDASNGSPLEKVLLDEKWGLSTFKDKDTVAEAFLAKIKRERAKTSEDLFIAAGRLGGKKIVQGLGKELLESGPDGAYVLGLTHALALTKNSLAVKPLLRFTLDQRSERERLPSLGAAYFLAGAPEVSFGAEEYGLLSEIIDKVESYARMRALEIFLCLIARTPGPPDEFLDKFLPGLTGSAKGFDPGAQNAAIKILCRFPEEYWDKVSPPLADIMDPKNDKRSRQERIDTAAELRNRKFAAEVVPLVLPLYLQTDHLVMRGVLWKTLKTAARRSDIPNDPPAWQAWWDGEREAATRAWQAKVLENLEAKKRKKEEDEARALEGTPPPP